MNLQHNQPTLGESFEDPTIRVGKNGVNKEMNRIFYEWIMDHANELNSKRGDLARIFKAKNILPTDARFPDWRRFETLEDHRR